MKKILRILGILLLIIVLVAASVIGYLTVTEYRPADSEPADRSAAVTTGERLQEGQTIRFLTWNIGYAGLDKDADFFMDGGKSVQSADKDRVLSNLEAITSDIENRQPAILFLQEIDRDGRRTYAIDELDAISRALGMDYTFAYNYKCDFVPYPLPPLGKMASGIATLSAFAMEDNAVRQALPVPYSWPVRIANLKRCLLITRFPIEGSDKELVTVNLHLEAYDDGEGRIRQTHMLMDILEEEYAKGNYVIAAGDFNQLFPKSLNEYPIGSFAEWIPGQLSEDSLPEGFRFEYNNAVPTCRLLNQPYDPTSPLTQYYVIDGYIVSDNLRVESVKTLDLDFTNADHNPVELTAVLETEQEDS